MFFAVVRITCTFLFAGNGEGVFLRKTLFFGRGLLLLFFARQKEREETKERQKGKKGKTVKMRRETGRKKRRGEERKGKEGIFHRAGVRVAR